MLALADGELPPGLKPPAAGRVMDGLKPVPFKAWVEGRLQSALLMVS